ncbi:hypothetical protein BK699_05445 [Bacillus thuringiensis serovar mexicanensis]|uniref:Uncharacterized protein n=1 Tax=Bacillus thuringiensis serovar mexicanensis TaxID=180868 RepID=A0A242WDX6_BACTU|nr:hypothetical protein BK699_05445 [Bacillus thuringiensis serovar mexicanensis]OTX10801.1 hypothetical protein BK705_01665 [Bacillus thuringiensis serovar monterrey]
MLRAFHLDFSFYSILITVYINKNKKVLNVYKCKITYSSPTEVGELFYIGGIVIACKNKGNFIL